MTASGQTNAVREGAPRIRTPSFHGVNSNHSVPALYGVSAVAPVHLADSMIAIRISHTHCRDIISST